MADTGTNKNKQMKAGIVGLDDVPYVWEEVAPLLQKAVKRSEGELSTDDVLEHIQNQTFQLWVAIVEEKIIMAMVTQFIDYPRKRVLRVLSIGGENFSVLHEKFNPMVESFALENGCTSLELWGRKGWKKMLPDWESKYIVFTKDLQKRMH